MDVDLFKELIFDKKKREEWLKEHNYDNANTDYNK